MQMAQLEQNERTQLEAWRLQQLLQAGWKQHRAELLAARHDIDLHQANHLIRKGCSQPLAMKILL